MGEFSQALDWGYKATHCFGSVSLGHDLVGRVLMRQHRPVAAMASFEQAAQANRNDNVAADHLMLAQYAAGHKPAARRLAQRRAATGQADLIPQTLLALGSEESLAQFAQSVREQLGEDDFELLEAGLSYAELGLYGEAATLVKATCVDAVEPQRRSFMPMYYLAWLESLDGEHEAAEHWFAQAAQTHKEGVFASRLAEIPVLRFAVQHSPQDGQACLQLGCLLAGLGRVDEAVPLWTKAAELSSDSIAWRNLGLVAATAGDVRRAEECYRQAIAARADDQTLYRDLAEILIADTRRPAAIELLESMPLDGPRQRRNYCDSG